MEAPQEPLGARLRVSPWLALLAAALPVYAFALIPLELELAHFAYDDKFYYLQAADHAAEGRPLSIDGESPTNGFHPLWMLVCVAVQSVFDRNSAMTAIQLIGATLHLLQGAILFSLLRRLGGPLVVAFAAAGFYLSSFRVLACNLSGMETTLSVTLLLATIHVFLGLTSEAGRRGFARPLALGLLLGGAMLARLDLVLLSAILLSAFALDPAFGPLRERVARAVLAGAVALGLLVPWFVWSWQTSATLLPNSRVALNFAGFDSPTFGHRLSVALDTLPDTVNALGLWPFVLPAHPWAVSVLLLLPILGGAALFFRLRGDTSLRPAAWVFLHGVVHLLWYVLFARVEMRYLLPFDAIVITCAALLATRWLPSALPRQRRLAAAGFALVLLMSFSAGVQAWNHNLGGNRSHGLHMGLYRLAQWANANTAPEQVIGAFNAGITSYFVERKLVNLDGVMNDRAIDAIRDKRLDRYIDEQQIDVILDVHGQPMAFLSRFSAGDEWRRDYRTLAKFENMTAVSTHRGARVRPGEGAPPTPPLR